MSTQAQLIHQTILNMRRAIRRSEDDSDSDESVVQNTNRSNKLKRKAHFVQEGRLDVPNGPKVYKRKMEHAGYSRDVIFKNPPRYDEEGFELEADEIDGFADQAVAELNPYADTKLEILLRPLTAAAELPTHPSLSIPYYSNAFPQLLQQVSKMVRDEKAALWKIKSLFVKFAGDEDWFPCGMFETELDAQLFQPATIQSSKASSIRDQVNDIGSTLEKEVVTNEYEEAVTAAIEPSAEDTMLQVDAPTESTLDPEASEDTLKVIERVETQSIKTVNQIQDKGGMAPKNIEDQKIKTEDGASGTEKTRSASEATTERGYDAAVVTNKSEESVVGPTDTPLDPTKAAEPSSTTADTQAEAHKTQDTEDVEEGQAMEAEDGEDEGENTSESQPVAHRMRTRAQAQAATSENNTTNGTRSQSPAALSDIPQIDPIFLAPESALPDRNFGLPPIEAEQMQRILWQYVQKQEEVCRNSEKLYEGLLKADRLRKMVLKWAKAEGHVGEMSDGEDWYDKEEWGLDDDLKKGHEEDEDDGNQGKKTRGRRS